MINPHGPLRRTGFIKYDDVHMWTGWTIVRVVLVGIVALGLLIFAISVGATDYDRHVQRYTCAHWGTANGRPTKFVSYTFWSYDCLTPNYAQPGTWISTHSPIMVGR